MTPDPYNPLARGESIPFGLPGGRRPTFPVGSSGPGAARPHRPAAPASVRSAELGARGPASGREFDPDRAGGPIRRLSTEGVQITPRGVAVVARHLARFDFDRDNAGMVQRLRDVAAGTLEPTEWDRRYYTHELREFVRYRRLGWADGRPEDRTARHDLWNDTHTATLEEYGLKGRIADLYHPDWRHDD